MSTKKKPKKPYIPPVIYLEFVRMEQALVAGSANVVPTNADGQVKQEWEVGEDIQRDLAW